jgi:hypothetical protein
VRSRQLSASRVTDLKIAQNIAGGVVITAGDVGPRQPILRPVNRETYGPGMWSHILRDQLDLDQATFWTCVQDGEKPDRGAPEPPLEALPADLVHLLLTQVRLSEADVAAMSKEEAIARMPRYWTTGT